MKRIIAIGFVILMTGTPRVHAADAKTLAQAILSKGAQLFDTKNAAAMAATYTEDAELTVITKESGSATPKVEITRGRADIERFYAKLFEDANTKFAARNVVEYAEMVDSDLLIIHGHFTPGEGALDKALPFGQTRTKQGENWRILSLQIILQK